MASMRALQIHRFGGADVLQIDQVEVPAEIGPREMIIKVAATSVNHSDINIRQNGNVHIGPKDLPLILGRELAGEVVEVGSSVSEFTPGQRVVALPAPQTRAIGLPGSKEFTGCCAQYALARPQDARLLPAAIDWVTGAAVPWCALTAWNVLATAKVKAGDTVFIQAGSSGVGHFAVQFAKLMGAARVITTAGSPEKCARIAELGADAVVDYKEQDFETETMRLTAGKGVDAAIDTIGGDALKKCFRILGDNARIIALGSLSGGSRDLPHTMPRGQSAARFSITAFLMEETRAIAQLDQIFAWIEAGRVKVLVDKVFPLAEAAAAHRHIEERRNFGKVVLML